jgi:hypothetical protein
MRRRAGLDPPVSGRTVMAQKLLTYPSVTFSTLAGFLSLIALPTRSGSVS